MERLRPLLPVASQYYLAMFGSWARPAALDMESKFSEGGLGSVMAVDYRNFAHGRHNWIHKLGVRTTVVAFITPDTELLAERTLKLLPAATKVIRFATDLSGPNAGLDLLSAVFAFTNVVGKLVGIDPGRPGVPPYGSRIYRLGPVAKGKSVGEDTKQAAMDRKLSARGTCQQEADRKNVDAALKTYIARLRKARFGAVVLDFDGTVVPPASAANAPLDTEVVSTLRALVSNDIALYFATGRGDSIHQTIANIFPSKYHSKVFISYYNGGVTLPVSHAPPRPEDAETFSTLANLLSIVQSDPLVGSITRITNKGFQLTLKATAPAHFRPALASIREAIARDPSSHLRIVQSSHSLDVIPRESSKLNCVRLAQSQLGDRLSVLTIGDKGSVSGNDFELLTHPLSLSVDRKLQSTVLLFRQYLLQGKRMPESCQNDACVKESKK